MLAELGKAITVFGSARTNPDDPYYAQAEELGRKLSEAGYAVITGGGPGDHGGGQQGLPRRRRNVGRARHRAALRAVDERVGRPRDGVPLLLRAQDLLPQVLHRLRRDARRLRHPRRDLRGRHDDPDRQDHAASRWCCSARPSGPRCSTGSRSTLLADGKISPQDLDLFHLTDDVDEAVADHQAAERESSRGTAEWRRSASSAPPRPRIDPSYVDARRRRSAPSSPVAATPWSAAGAPCPAWARSPAPPGRRAPARSGVIPAALLELEVGDRDADELLVVDDMRDPQGPDGQPV